MKSPILGILLVAAAMMVAGPARAAADVDGMVLSLNHFDGHQGILVKLDQQMIDPEACGRSDWYLLPDSNTHAQFVQAMLLSAQGSQRRVYISINGCLDGMPRIRAVRN